MRDRDKQAVYYAEALVFENTLYDEAVTDADIHELADELFGSDWWVSRKLPVPVLRHRRLEAAASCAMTYRPFTGRNPEIRFSTRQINARTLAHEASHIATNYLYDFVTGPTESHGLEFRDTYLDISAVLLGDLAAFDLHNAFLRFVRPRKKSPVVSRTLVASSGCEENGIFQDWRTRKQVEDLRKAAAAQRARDLHPAGNAHRIGGAIAL